MASVASRPVMIQEEGNKRWKKTPYLAVSTPHHGHICSAASNPFAVLGPSCSLQTDGAGWLTRWLQPPAKHPPSTVVVLGTTRVQRASRSKMPLLGHHLGEAEPVVSVRDALARQGKASKVPLVHTRASKPRPRHPLRLRRLLLLLLLLSNLLRSILVCIVCLAALHSDPHTHHFLRHLRTSPPTACDT